MKTKLYFGHIDPPNRLAQLGLADDVLWQAVMYGQSQAANCTPDHPRLYRGVVAWGETTYGLRQVLLPKEWKKLDEGNLPLTINDAGTVRITVATGDEYTGRKEGNPCTKSKKGPRTSDAVRDNALQTSLFGEIHLNADELKKIDGRLTWMLLFHYDHTLSEVRCELSLPTKMNDDDHVDGWIERIILGSRPFGGDNKVAAPDVPQSPKIDVDVKRRHA